MYVKGWLNFYPRVYILNKSENATHVLFNFSTALIYCKPFHSHIRISVFGNKLYYTCMVRFSEVPYERFSEVPYERFSELVSI